MHGLGGELLPACHMVYSWNGISHHSANTYIRLEATK